MSVHVADKSLESLVDRLPVALMNEKSRKAFKRHLRDMDQLALLDESTGSLHIDAVGLRKALAKAAPREAVARRMAELDAKRPGVIVDPAEGARRRLRPIGWAALLERTGERGGGEELVLDPSMPAAKVEEFVRARTDLPPDWFEAGSADRMLNKLLADGVEFGVANCSVFECLIGPVSGWVFFILVLTTVTLLLVFDPVAIAGLAVSSLLIPLICILGWLWTLAITGFLWNLDRCTKNPCGA
jgi:hypothetical protein